MTDYIIVDGYNVINCWQEFASLREKSLEHARELLVAGIAEYAAFKGCRGIVVFDAMEVPGAADSALIHGIEVVYTGEGETADSWIERRAYELRRESGGSRVFVVTSDYAEQISVLGSGSYRVSSREFREEYHKTKKEIAARLRHPASGLNRRELGDRLDSRVLERFERLRRK